MGPWEKLPVVECRGAAPSEIGRSHGEQLRTRIDATLDFYFGRFAALGVGSDGLRSWGDACRSEVGAFAPELAEEIAGIAEGAGRQAWELFALNARSELLAAALRAAGRAAPGECTSAYCAASAWLGQNWDWDARMDSLLVLLRIPACQGRPQILTVTEPGMVGKIGFNDCGVGVCLNFLAAPGPPAGAPAGVPVHCLLRLALGCRTLRDADAQVRAAPRGTTCHILLADAIGQFRMLELAGDALESAASDPLSANVGVEEPIEGSEWQVVQASAVVHTNHYLHPRFAALSQENLAHSRERYARATQLVDDFDGAPGVGHGADAHLELMKRILGDRSGAPRSILYDGAPGVFGDGAPLGTICSVIMDLRSLCAHVTRGSAMRQEYARVPLRASAL